MTLEPIHPAVDDDYLTPEQVGQLLRAINKARVSSDGKGFSHVQAYELRAHLNRILGFGRWSDEIKVMQPIFEDSQVMRRKNKQGEEYGEPFTAWTVCYRAAMRVEIYGPRTGKLLAFYEDGATGEGVNQPSRGDAHDLALKTALSQAFKRALVNLGDQFGNSLYAGGSIAAITKRTLLMPDVKAAQEGVDDDAPPVVPEGTPHEPTPDPRVTSQTPAAPGPQAPVAAGPVEGGVTPVAPPPTPPDDEQRTKEARRIRDLAAGDIPSEYRNSPGKWVMHLTGEAVKAKALTEPVESLISPNKVALKVVLEQALKTATDAQRKAS